MSALVRWKGVAAILLVLVVALAGLSGYTWLQYSGALYEVKELSSRNVELQRRLAGLQSELERIKEELARLLGYVETSYPLEVVDGLGRLIVIPKQPTRIISGAPSITEILYAVGAGRLIVGVDKFSDFPLEIVERVKRGEVEVIGGVVNPDVEKIIALKPDVVFMVVGLQRKWIYRLEELKVPVVALASELVADVVRDIALVGKILNLSREAADVVAKISEKVADVKERVDSYIANKGISKVKVYWEAWPEPLWTTGGKSFVNDAIALAGGVNVFGNETWSWSAISPESVILRAPEVIVTTTHGGLFGEPAKLIEAIVSRPGWATIPAVKANRVHVVVGALEGAVIRPGPRISLAVEVLAKVFYPEAFGLKHVPSVIDEEFLRAQALLAIPAIMRRKRPL